jgi:hypothetical protein
MSTKRGGSFNVYLNPEDRERLHQLSAAYGGASGSLILRAALQVASESTDFRKAFESTFHRVYLRGV